MTAGVTTGRAQHAGAQRNLALAAYEDLVAAIGAYQAAGVLGVEVATELYSMAGVEVAARLAELDAFEERERPSRLIPATGPRPYEWGGVAP